MPDAAARLLFLPVSGPRGMGEYARAIAIATAVAQRWPQVEIRFALSRSAAYAAETPFQATLLPSSPTFHSREVAALLREFKPTVVLFDNAGRSSQLRAAVAGGARTVFISSRPKQRRRAFRLRWMRLLDEHWIAYPQFIAGPLSSLEKLKLLWLRRPRVRFLDTVLPQVDLPLGESVMTRFGLVRGEYVLVVPGGGTGHPGALDAPQIVADAARRIAQKSYPTILVGVTPRTANAPATEVPALRLAPRLPVAMVGELIRGARLVISNGGDTMLQVLACRRPCVAVAIAGDQAHRIRQCVRQGLAVRARLDVEDLERVALGILDTDGAQARAQERVIANGLDTALNAIAELAGLDGAPAVGRKRSAFDSAVTAGEAAPQICASVAPRILLLPVSGPHGMGEYVRTLQIAHAAAARWPNAEIHFALSRKAPYEPEGAFASTLLPSSPTFHTPEVIALIEELRPHVVIFDNAGRTAQLRAAQRAGARVVYISARARQRRKAFRLRWMSLIDEHWMAYPEFLSGPLSALEKIKLRFMGRPLLRYLDVMLPAADARAAATVLGRFELKEKPYVLVVPGGGTGHPGAHGAVQIFATAAQMLAARGIQTVLVAPPRGYDTRTAATLKEVPHLPLPELAILMRHAQVVVANGGSTMLQVIACRTACIAVPIAKDQTKRVRQCADAGLVASANLSAEHIAGAAAALLNNESARTALVRQATKLKLADGVAIALTAIESLYHQEARQ